MSSSSSISRFMLHSSMSSLKPSNKALLFNPNSKSDFLRNKEAAAWSLHGRSCRRLSMSVNLDKTTTFVRQSNVTPPPEPPLPSGSPSGSLRNWIAGLVLTFILPFFTHKWGSWLLLKDKIDTKIETTEHVVKAIEEIAEKADKVLDSITEDLPEGNKLKTALEYVDQIAEGVAKGAHAADDIIIKVEEAEDKIESLIHLENSKEGEIPQQPQEPKEENDNDQK